MEQQAAGGPRRRGRSSSGPSIRSEARSRRRDGRGRARQGRGSARIIRDRFGRADEEPARLGRARRSTADARDGRHRDGRPAHVEPGGSVRSPEPLDEDRPGDLALAIGQIREQLAEDAARGVEDRVRAIAAGPRGQRVATVGGPRQLVAGGDEGRAAALRRRPVPGSTWPRTITQRIARRSRWSAERSTARVGSAARREEALDLVALGELERGKSLVAAGTRSVRSAASVRSQRRGCPGCAPRDGPRRRTGRFPSTSGG